MKRVYTLFALLILASSCKKENCDCFTITEKNKLMGYVLSENVCTKAGNTHWMGFGKDIDDYTVGQVVCNDPFIQ